MSDPAWWAKARQLRAAGLSFKRIGAMLGVDESSVRFRLDETGRREGQLRAHAEAKARKMAREAFAAEAAFEPPPVDAETREEALRVAWACAAHLADLRREHPERAARAGARS